jgi:hypothetical protein
MTQKTKSNGGLFPDLNEALEDLKTCIQFKDGIPTPLKGVSQEYD